MEQYDVTIIGAGVIGCAAAREISRFQLRILVLEKDMDVASGNSSRNTGLLHAGFTYAPGSLKAECAVEGNQEFDHVAEELDIPFKRTGKLVIGFDETDRANILKFKKIGEINGVKGMRMISREEMDRIDPNAGGEFAMYVPSSGILDPMQYTIDIDTDGADILVWKDDEIPLAIFWSEGYLTEKEKKKAIEYHREKSPGLTLAFSLLHDRSWILIYRFGDSYVEYLHIDKYTFDENVIKRLIIPEKAKDDGQLMLSLKPERKRERRKEGTITQDQ